MIFSWEEIEFSTYLERDHISVPRTLEKQKSIHGLKMWKRIIQHASASDVPIGPTDALYNY